MEVTPEGLQDNPVMDMLEELLLEKHTLLSGYTTLLMHCIMSKDEVGKEIIVEILSTYYKAKS